MSLAADGTNDDASVANANLYTVQTRLFPHIERALASMHHIDETFPWPAHLLARSFHIPLLLIRANRHDQYDHQSAQLRTMTRQDHTFPA